MSVTLRTRYRLSRLGFVLVLALLSLVATTLPAVPALADGRPPLLAEIERDHDAKIASLEAEQDRRIEAAEDASAVRQAQITAVHDAEVARLRAAADAASQQRAAELAAQVGALEAAAQVERDQVTTHFDGRASELTEFIEGVASTLGSSEQPSKAALKLAKDQLKAEERSQRDALEAVIDAEVVAHEAEADAVLAALDAEADQVSVSLEAREQELIADFESTQRELLAELATVRADSAAILDSLEADFASEMALIRDAQAAVQLEARARGEDVKPLERAHDAEVDALEDRHDEAIDAEEVRQELREQEIEDRLEALEDDLDRDLDTAEGEHDAVADQIEDAIDAAEDELDAAEQAMDADHKVREDRLKLFYKTAIRGIEHGHVGLERSLAAGLVQLDEEEQGLLNTVADRLDDRIDRVESIAARVDAAAAADLRDDLHALEDDTALRRHREEDRLEAEVATIGRQIARQVRLAEAELYALTKRAEAFLSSGQFESLDSTFDPASDDGSLYNVARRINAHKVEATGEGIDVALIDTGVVDVEGLAEADVVIGPDFSFEDINPDLRGRDTNGHGTHMAGLIVGRDQQWVDGQRVRRPERFIGIAPDARLVSLKVGAADGSVDVTQVIAAINWVIANRNADGLDIRVINLSFGTDGVQDHQVDPLSHAVERAWHAGIVVVVAAGNDGWEAERLTNPAQNPYVIAVAASQAASGDDSVPSGFSNGTRAARTVDLAAPGRSIVGLRVPGSFVDEQAPVSLDGRFIRGSGTSQAAAVVSGAVALLLSANPGLTPDQVKGRLMASAESGDDPALVGAGYLDIEKAMRSSDVVRAQSWPRSNGTGTMDGARGTVRVLDEDGVVLHGEVDIFGNDWSGSRWSQDAWSGSRWSGSRWSGSRWSGSRWSADLWSGTSWSGSRWSGSRWSGSRWSGSRWSSDGFTGSRWSGSRWSAGGWFGAGWSHARGVVD